MAVARERILLSGGTVLRCDERFTVATADVLVDADGRVAAVAPELAGSPAAEGARVVRCDGAAVLPGWVQTHVHVCQTLLRNRADDLELLDWLKARVWPYEAALEPEDLAAATRLACLELLTGGTTGILDMGTVRHHDAVFEALAEAGIRAASGKCMMDRGEGVPAPMLEDTDASLRESADLCDRWHGREEGRLSYAYAPRFALSCSEHLLRVVAEETRRRDVRLHTHASENPTECALVREATGHDNVDWLGEVGAEGPHVVLAHCVHLTDREVARMAEAGTRAVHCPSSNLKLASGVALVPETAAAGVHWSLGADGAPCNNNLDAFQEVRLAALLHKHRVGPTAMPAAEALRMATVAGAQALGWDAQVGIVEPGKRADLQVVDLSSPAVQPDPTAPDAIAAALVYSARASDVRHVLVDGRLVVEDGRCRTLDPDKVRSEANAAWARVKGRLTG